MKPEPKNHHFIPQLLLNNFTNDDGKFYVYNKNSHNKGIYISTPKSTFSETHLYSEIDEQGNKDPSLEYEFAELESKAKPIVKKIIVQAKKNQIPYLNNIEKKNWNDFYYSQWARVPDFIETLEPEEEIKKVIKEFEEEVRPLNIDEKKYYENSDTLKRLSHNAVIESLKVNPERVLDILNQKGITIGKINKTKKSFIIGSFPIVQFYGGEINIENPEAEAWFPISYNIVVTPSPENPRELLIDFDNPDWIRKINLTIFNQSTVVACRSKKLLESIVNNR